MINLKKIIISPPWDKLTDNITMYLSHALFEELVQSVLRDGSFIIIKQELQRRKNEIG